jgi:hypothetical protein
MAEGRWKLVAVESLLSYEKLERQMKSWRLADRKQVTRRWKSSACLADRRQ